MGLNQGLAGQKFCTCGQLTRRIVEEGTGRRVEIPKEIAIGHMSGGFTALKDSHYAQDGKCWRCAKPEGYFDVGRQSGDEWGTVNSRKFLRRRGTTWER